MNVTWTERIARFAAVAATALAAVWMGASQPNQFTQARQNADVAITCDEDIDLGADWRSPIYETNVDSVLCYRISNLGMSQIRREAARRRQPVTISLTPQSGQFDVYWMRAVGNTTPIARNANRLSAGGGSTVGTYVYTSGPLLGGSYVLVIAPRSAGNYWLNIGVGAATVAPVPGTPPIAVPAANNQCSNTWGTLSNFCVEAPGLTANGGSVSVVWRIGNFRYGEFDSGDGRGYVGPIAAEQRVVVNNFTANRVIRLRWWDLNNTERVDTLQIPLSNAAPAPTQVPQTAVNPNFPPCSQTGIGRSNLCVEQPYPIKRGTSAAVVWRIASFQSGSFDSGDGRDYVGPINVEQRIVIPNITANRTVQLRWTDSNGVQQNDSFVIQVVD